MRVWTWMCMNSYICKVHTYLFIDTPNLTTKSRAWKIGVCYVELIWEQELHVKSICEREGGRIGNSIDVWKLHSKDKGKERKEEGTVCVGMGT